MNLPTLAVVLVALAFTALLVWVLLPSNKARLEAHGAIPLSDEPLEDGDSKLDSHRRSR